MRKDFLTKAAGVLTATAFAGAALTGCGSSDSATATDTTSTEAAQSLTHSKCSINPNHF